MKAKNPSTGNFEEVYVKALDSLPVGSEIDFTGSASDIPVGWEQTNNFTQVFSGSTAAGNASTINTTWEAIGKFKYLLVEMYLEVVNAKSVVIIPYFMLSAGNNLNDDKIRANITFCTAYPNASENQTIYPHLIPVQNITSNSITFDNYGTNAVISAIYIQY